MKRNEGQQATWSAAHTKVKREAIDIGCNYKSRNTVACSSSQCQDIVQRVLKVPSAPQKKEL